MANIIFINASENKDGNTASLGEKLISGRDAEKLDLVDYKIYQIGQNYSDDQFEEVYSKMAKAETIVLGTPVYWHEMSAALKTLIERISQRQGHNDLSGKQIVLIIQGAFPMDGVKETSKIIDGFCKNGSMTYLGHASSSLGISKLGRKL